MLYLSLVILIGLSLRIVFLNEVPPGLANDEANIILNAQSIIYTGQNIPGVVTGVFGQSLGDLSGGIHSEISSYLLIPAIAIFGFNLVSVKLPFILSSLGIVVLIFLLTKRLINHQAAFIAVSLASINPWLIFFARSAYESIFSSFFYLLAIFLVIRLKGMRVLFTIPFFIAGLFSYFSAKTLLLPLTLVSFPAVKFFKARESLKPVVILNIIIFVFLIFYLVSLRGSPAGGRFSELQGQDLTGVVNSRRTISLNMPTINIYENKLTEDIFIRLKNSLGQFSVNFLFLDGQPESIPSLGVPNHGFLYLIDFPLIILGFIFLARFNLKLLFFLSSLILITLIPNFLNLAGTTYVIRTVILFPILIIFSAAGIYYSKSATMVLKAGKVFFALLMIIYLFFVGNFIYQYFGRMPLDRNEGYFLHQRILAKYITFLQNENPNTQINIISQDPKQTFYKFLFFSGNYTKKEGIVQINEKLKLKDYSFGRMIITSKCSDSLTDDAVYIIDVKSNCPHPKGVNIASPRDSARVYLVINDKFCQSYVSKHYPLIKNMTLLNIEKLSKEDFCSNFFTI